MVFLIQRSQNKDSQAIQLKLNEIIAAIPGASNRLINVEDHCEKEGAIMHKQYRKLAASARSDVTRTKPHTIDETAERHNRDQQT
jgi:low affinity Fe/Cu permease